jgi:multidrug efflux pump subunit AcrA (membrane-fusion protein)
MRIDPADVATRRRPTKWAPGTDAPTFLSIDEPTTIARGSQPGSDSVVTSAPQSSADYDSVVTSAPRSSFVEATTVFRRSQGHRARQRTALPLPAEPVSEPQRPVQPTPRAQVTAEPTDQQPSSQPDVAPYLAFEDGATFDPLALPLPPEVAPAIYGWIRRLALQAELPAADRLMRDALADLTSALSVIVIYSGPDGLHTIGASDELPDDLTPIQTVARARRALVGTHIAHVPIVTATETIAVIRLIRNSRQPAFNLVDHVMMAGLARESASIMHHLLVQHLHGRLEHEADKKSLYRPEALDSHRKRGQEGVVTELSPGWVRRTYQVLVGSLVIALLFAFFIQVPTYSSGSGVVVFDGTQVTSPTPGTVDRVLVQPAQLVRKNDLLVSLKADKERSDLDQARTELDAALQQYLFDSGDETIKKTLVTAQAAVHRAEDALEQKNVRAPSDGTVSDIRIRAGGALEFGAQILTIVAPGTEPELWAYLPGSDRPRLRPGQALQIELTGYQKTRETAKIYDVGRNVIGANEAKRSLGQELADALRLGNDGGSYVLVKAKLPARTFRARGRKYNYHPGMPAMTEVRVERKRFIVTLLPSLEKYLP